MPSHKNDPNCHCAVCHDGYSRIDSTSTSLTRGPSLRTAGAAGSAMTLTSECLSAGRGSPTRGPAATAGGYAEGGGAGRVAGAQRPSLGGGGTPAAPAVPGTPGGPAKPRPRPTGAGVGKRSALADKYMYSDMDYEPEPEPVAEIEDVFVDLERDDSDLHKVAGRAEPYFPQPEDDQNPACAGEAEPMEPVGPWAQGKPDWGPLSGMTGTRPAVDRYSITRYSVPEWRKHNLDTFQRAAGDNHNAGMVDFNSRACMQHVAAEADKNQADSTGRLEQRAMDVHRWLAEVRKAHKALWDELQLLEAYRARLRRLLCTLTKCANVAGQCLDLRNRRNEPDLVRDEPEEELVKEVALIKEVSELMKRCLIQVEDQLRASRAAKGRLSGNWSDKKQAYDVDTNSGGLRSGAPTATFHEGATRFADSQSTPESWEAASREDICLAENERAKSAMLRNLIDAMVHDSGRDLRQQEARVDEAVQRRAQVVAALLQELESQLALILRRIMETERLIEDLKHALRQLDMALKVAQTRLHSRLGRQRVENARDGPQYGLVDEVKSISEQCSALLGQLKQAENTLQSLVDTRGHLEKDIVSKRKNLHLDRDRIQVIRQHYPPAAALTGLH